jgi:hypothetical protein
MAYPFAVGDLVEHVGDDGKQDVPGRGRVTKVASGQVTVKWARTGNEETYPIGADEIQKAQLASRRDRIALAAVERVGLASGGNDAGYVQKFTEAYSLVDQARKKLSAIPQFKSDPTGKQIMQSLDDACHYLNNLAE